mgnify:CR=1 FL=1
MKKAKNVGTGIDELKKCSRKSASYCMVYPDCPCTDADSKTDRKEKKQEKEGEGEA